MTSRVNGRERRLIGIIVAQFLLVLMLAFRPGDLPVYLNDLGSRDRGPTNWVMSDKGIEAEVPSPDKRHRFRCQPLDYTIEDWGQYALDPSELENYTIHNMLLKTPPPMLPNYANPCWPDSRGSLHCLPGIMLVGVAKCGTSEIHRNLITHPDVEEARFKELGYWALMVAGHSLRRYLTWFENVAPRIGQNCVNESGLIYHPQLTLDSSPETVFGYKYGGYQNLLENAEAEEPRLLPPHYIHHVLPGSKVIIVLRDPVKRLYSEYLYFSRHKNASQVSPEHFHGLVSSQVEELTHCEESYSARRCAYHLQHRAEVRVAVGMYDIYVEDWLNVIPRDQLYIFRLEDYSTAKVEEMRRLYHFLDLSTEVPGVYEEIRRARAQNARPEKFTALGDMLPRTRTRLSNFYRTHNHRLAKLLGDDRYTWGY